MPLPKPHSGETREHFMSRCMANPTMREDFPDRDQRVAVCARQWRGKGVSMTHAESHSFEGEPVSAIPWDLVQTKRMDFEAEIKAEEGETGVFSGMASTFGNKDLVGDIIERGAFTKSLKRRSAEKIKMLWQHMADEPIGVWESMEETDRGLKVKGRLLVDQMVPLADKAFSLMRAKAIDALSIGFRIPDGGATFDREKNIRRIHEIDLLEVSAVTFPANPRARIGAVKTFSPDDIRTKRQLENVLRDAGFSRATAAYVATHWQEPARRDAEGEGRDELIAVISAASKCLRG